MMILKTSRSNLSSNDQLALDLPFAATKSIAARVGPTPVFTRASGATYIGSDGLIHGVDTSTTSNSIGTGSRTFTLAATAGQDQLWRAGDAVEASNGSNFMVGTVTSYNAATQSLVCNMTSTGGSGTFTSWRIGYREPRFDHDSAGVCKGLLIEESRTNSITGSNAFNAWTTSNSTVAASSVVTPEGTADAWKVVEDMLLAAHTVTRSFSAVSGTTYTASVWLKSAENGFVFVGLSGGGFATPTFVSVNLSTGAVTTAVGTPIGATSVAHSNGWWRVSFSLAATASLSSNIDIRLSRDGNWANRSYSGNGVNGMYCYGGQVEAGSFATSYIPTVASSVVRSADVCSITGGNFTSFWNTNEGAIFASGDPRAGANVAALVMANSGVNANQIAFDRISTAIKFGIANSGTYTATISQNSTNGSFVKISGAYATNNARSALNGVLGTPDTSVIVPTNLNRFNIGSAGAANTEFANGCISEIKYFRKPLSNAKLQALTV
jgi:hypothetical protein